MRLYLDDDSVNPLLIRLLRKAGHDVLLPADIGQVGCHDAVHLANAIRLDRAALTGNHVDFVPLHELIMTALSQHAGILLVRRDNDRNRDLKPAGIVRAIVNLLAAAIPISDNLHILNHWR
jgi:hypothetical protein